MLDCVGNLTIESGRRLLTQDGVQVLLVASLWDSIRARGNVVAGSAPGRVRNIELLLDLVDNGELTAVHDSSYDLDHIVDAYRRVDSGRKRGNVVVHPWPDDEGRNHDPNVERSVAGRDQSP